MTATTAPPDSSTIDFSILWKLCVDMTVYYSVSHHEKMTWKHENTSLTVKNIPEGLPDGAINSVALTKTKISRFAIVSRDFHRENKNQRSSRFSRSLWHHLVPFLVTVNGKWSSLFWTTVWLWPTGRTSTIIPITIFYVRSFTRPYDHIRDKIRWWSIYLLYLQITNKMQLRFEVKLKNDNWWRQTPLRNMTQHYRTLHYITCNNKIMYLFYALNSDVDWFRSFFLK